VSQWQKYSVAELIADGNLVIGDGYRAKNDELTTHGLPFARAGNINCGFQFADADRFPKENISRIGNKVSEPGDVVFTSKGTVGRFALVRDDTQRFVYSPQLCFWRTVDRTLIEPRFLYFWMYGREFFLQYKGVAGQTDMAEYVSLGDQRRMQITLPEITEQRAIASVLGSLDDKIELNRRMNETMEALAQSLFKSRFVDTTQSALPKGWEVRGLDEIADFLNGLALQKFPPNGDNSLPVIKIAQLRAGHTEGADRAGMNLPTQYIIENGDILFSWSGSLLVDIWCGGRGALNQHLFKVTSAKFPKWFYYLWTRHHLAAFQNTAADKATTMGHIQRHHLSEARVFIPTSAELEKMGKQMSPLIDKLVADNLESRTLAALRDALLPKLLSGELHVRNERRNRG
jgi:type I restriction enzyme S subunit